MRDYFCRVQSDVEHRKQKAEAKRKQIAFLESTKKMAKRKLVANGTVGECPVGTLPANGAATAIAQKDHGGNVAKLNQEILHLKSANKSLEEKILVRFVQL